jgi:hypothetical protein
MTHSSFFVLECTLMDRVADCLLGWIPYALRGRRYQAKMVRAQLRRCIEEHEDWEREHAGYDAKVGLVACYRVERALERTSIASSPQDEAKAIRRLLRHLMNSEGLVEGEYSTEAASIGSILGRFSACVDQCGRPAAHMTLKHAGRRQ